jgi:predicted DNA-binding protein
MNTTFTFEIPKEVKINFNILAVKQGRSMADIIRELMENYLKENSLEEG